MDEDSGVATELCRPRHFYLTTTTIMEASSIALADSVMKKMHENKEGAENMVDGNDKKELTSSSASIRVTQVASVGSDDAGSDMKAFTDIDEEKLVAHRTCHGEPLTAVSTVCRLESWSIKSSSFSSGKSLCRSDWSTRLEKFVKEHQYPKYFDFAKSHKMIQGISTCLPNLRRLEVDAAIGKNPATNDDDPLRLYQFKQIKSFYCRLKMRHRSLEAARGVISPRAAYSISVLNRDLWNNKLVHLNIAENYNLEWNSRT